MPAQIQMTCWRCGADHQDGVAYCSACGANLGGSDISCGVQVDAVFGSYRLLQQIGQGGMGRVFVAEHTRLGRQVALKMLRSEYAGNVEAVKRFFSEARAVNRIKHENIIEISDFVENDRGHSYYIMELLKGVDLRALEDRERILPLDRALNIAIQIARGIAAAHAGGIVHRDLKPDNVFIVDRGDGRDFVKLLDFGVAKLLNPSDEEVSTFKTSAGIVVGTPDYMSPEQGAGKRVDHRTDIYSLGVMLFEMISGRRPFQAESFGELMIQHMTVPPPRPSAVRSIRGDLPPGLERLILSCLAKEPGDRPPAMVKVEQGLTAIARGAIPDELDFAERTAIRAPPTRRRRRSILAIGGATLALLGGAGFALHQRTRAAAPAVAALAATPVATPPGRGRVEVSFASNPPGAAVFSAGAREPLGVTPFSSSFPTSSQGQTFEFRLAGRRSERREVVLASDTHLSVALLAEPAPVITPPVASQRAQSRHRATRLDRTAVLDPFK